MKINFTIKKYKVILIVVVAVIFGGGIMLSRPIVKKVTLRPCVSAKDEHPYSPMCDQDGNVLYWNEEYGGGGSENSMLDGIYVYKPEKNYSLSILKNRLHFIFKKYMLGIEDKGLRDAFIHIKIVNQEQYGG